VANRLNSVPDHHTHLDNFWLYVVETSKALVIRNSVAKRFDKVGKDYGEWLVIQELP
jgi:hypothetical protein